MNTIPSSEVIYPRAFQKTIYAIAFASIPIYSSWICFVTHEVTLSGEYQCINHRNYRGK